MSIKCGREVKGSDTTAKISSVYNNNLCSLSPPLTPLIPGCALTDTARTSKKMMNSYGLSEHPCRVPRFRLKKGEIIPFVITAALGSLYNIFFSI